RSETCSVVAAAAVIGAPPRDQDRSRPLPWGGAGRSRQRSGVSARLASVELCTRPIARVSLAGVIRGAKDLIPRVLQGALRPNSSRHPALDPRHGASAALQLEDPESRPGQIPEA